MSIDGRCIKWRRNIAEKFNRLSTHERYTRQTDRQTDRRQTDGWTIAYSERVAKNQDLISIYIFML